MINIRCCLGGALAVLAAVLPAISPAQAADPKKPPVAATPAAPAAQVLGKSGGWAAYASHDKTGRVCYLVGQPQKSEPAGFGRTAPTAMVTHRPVEKIANVVSFVEGYALKEGSEVVLDIGGSKFELFTKDDSAWARTADLDRSIVAALAKGRLAVVKAVPQKGPATTDTYPLAGFAQALAQIDKACGVQREEKPKPSAVGRHGHRKPARP